MAKDAFNTSDKKRNALVEIDSNVKSDDDSDFQPKTKIKKQRKSKRKKSKEKPARKPATKKKPAAPEPQFRDESTLQVVEQHVHFDKFEDMIVAKAAGDKCCKQLDAFLPREYSISKTEWVHVNISGNDALVPKNAFTSTFVSEPPPITKLDPDHLKYGQRNCRTVLILGQEFGIPMLSDSQAAFILKYLQIHFFSTLAEYMNSTDVDISQVHVSNINIPDNVALGDDSLPTSIALHNLMKSLAMEYGPSHPSADPRYNTWKMVNLSLGEENYKNCMCFNLIWNSHHFKAPAEKSIGYHNDAVWKGCQRLWLAFLSFSQPLLGIIVPLSSQVRNTLEVAHYPFPSLFQTEKAQAFHPCTLYIVGYATYSSLQKHDAYYTDIVRQRLGDESFVCNVGTDLLNDDEFSAMVKLREKQNKEALELMITVVRTAIDKWMSGGKFDVEKFTDDEMLELGYTDGETRYLRGVKSMHSTRDSALEKWMSGGKIDFEWFTNSDMLELGYTDGETRYLRGMQNGVKSIHSTRDSALKKWMSGGKFDVKKFTDDEMLELGYTDGETRYLRGMQNGVQNGCCKKSYTAEDKMVQKRSNFWKIQRIQRVENIENEC